MSCYGSDSSYLMDALLLSSTAKKRRKTKSTHSAPPSAERTKKKKGSNGLAKWIKKMPCVMAESSPDRSPSPQDDEMECVEVSMTAPLSRRPSPERFLIPPLSDAVIGASLDDLERQSHSVNVRQCYEKLTALRATRSAIDTWTSKYAPTESGSLLGNDFALLKLKTWLNDWKLYVEKHAGDEVQAKEAQSKSEKRAKKAREKAASRKRRREPGTDSDSDASDEFRVEAPEEMPLTGYMVYGPCGVGKTAAMHALAGELGFVVLEINPASCKDAKQILLHSLEATQSHRMHVKSTNPLTHFFHSSHPAPDESKKKRTTTLILIDDADVLPEGEETFISSLENMLQKSKRPVIFTISGLSKVSLINPQLFEIGDLDFFRQPMTDVACYLSLIGLVESTLISYTDSLVMVRSANGDLRAAINLAQFWWSPRGQLILPPYPQPVSFTRPLPDSPAKFPLFTISDDESGEEAVESCERPSKTSADVTELLNRVLDTVVFSAEEGKVEEATASKLEEGSDSGFGSQWQSPKEITSQSPRSSSPEIVDDSAKRRFLVEKRDYAREFHDADWRSQLAALTSGRDFRLDSTSLSCTMPQAGVCEAFFEESPARECRFSAVERSAEVGRTYADHLPLADFADFSHLVPDAMRSGRTLFHRYGQFNPQSHVRGRQFGSDQWSYIRGMAQSEGVRQVREEREKRRRLRFYHYLGRTGLELSDELIHQLTSEIGSEIPREKADEFPSCL